MQQPIWNFEQEPTAQPMDETGIKLPRDVEIKK